ncbi:chemotactic signal transduction system substrate-binding protein BasB [Halobacterium salinarum]|uniref:Chemotactic signal transduction system substrate-binding protein BasB n=4 Tax=Halobacterium salinarum TaxID=2242 RepID=BASB_HALS3|nr:chemotactic signal transduction system substrate-binding protein BasB [Halobacterium salinarum]B0R6I5.1 RecName: Full=Chemotactic signal transduction system substrate-binding protein BasB; AltName: Full=Amino acid binding protein; Flags: Precursor [Halobacterium salinarum R1]AAG20061.1 conserved hypothetical protein [Halobacterium salinarum NRC-1]MBB6089071.1 ABC-type branched-subunit amino acid transport system substrate-binding protein [Halobacterium salinarum]MDL0119501.1 chemotactic sign
MHSTTRREWLGAIGATAATGLAGCAGVGGAGQPVTVGSLLPLSGPGSLGALAADHQRAIDTAVEHANRGGGINGRDVVHVSKDTEADPSVAADRYATLAADESPLAIVGPVLSGVTTALTEQAAADAQLLVSPSTTAPAIATAGRSDGQKFVARTCPNDSQQAAVMAKIVDDDMYAAADTATILYVDNAFGAALADVLADRLGADLLASVPYQGGTDTPGGPVDDALAPDPDAVAFIGSPGSSSGVIDELVGREYGGEIALSSALASASSPPSWNGAYTATVNSASTVGTKRLRRALSDATPLQPYTENAYDAAALALLAASYSGDPTPRAVAGALQSVSGGVGHSITVGDFGRATDLIDAGRELNYNGATGNVDLTAALEPVTGYLIQQLTDAGIETRELLKSGYFTDGGDA